MEKRKTIIIGITGHIISDQRIQRIAGTLAGHDFKVIVCYRHFFKYREIKSSHDFPFETRAINVGPISRLFNSTFRTGVLFYLWYNLFLFLKILFTRTDYLYAVDSDTLPAFTLLSICKGRPLIFDSHEYFAEVPELSGALFKKKIWHRVTRMGVRRSSACITVGHELAKVLEKRYGKPFITIRNVPVYWPLETTEKLSPPVILYQGALNAGRELELLISVVQELPELNCIIAGEGDLSKDLREQAASNPRIQFAGLLSPEALKKLTLQCFAGYNLLAPGSLSYYYSLSNKYFDYMHAGVPSISSRLPEYLALNAENLCGECIDNTKEALASTLRQWLNDETHYKKLKENAIIASQKLNWENEKQQLLNLFKEV